MKDCGLRSRELIQAFRRAIYNLRDDEFSERKKNLLIEAFKKGDTSLPVVREWVRLAERYYPNVPWRRILCLDEDEEDWSRQGKTSEDEKCSG